MAPASIGAHALDTANFLPAGVRDGAWSLPGVKWQKDCIRPVDRRRFLELVGASALTATLRTRSALTEETTPDYTIRIGTGPVELAPAHIVSTTLYNSQFPGPLIRFKEGQHAIVDIYNDTDVPELVHWHGQIIPSDVDGASEEGSPFAPARGMQRVAFVPQPAGFRFYHTHVAAGANLNRGTYTGLAGPVYIEPKHEAGAYDREIFLVMKEFSPSFSRGGDMAMDMLASGEPIKELKEAGAKADEESKGTAKGYEVGYELFSINGKMLGAAEPIRVKQGERVLFHVLNASATEIRSLALPGHVFRVVALDGNPVPTAADVPVLWLGTAERYLGHCGHEPPRRVRTRRSIRRRPQAWHRHGNGTASAPDYRRRSQKRSPGSRPDGRASERAPGPRHR